MRTLLAPAPLRPGLVDLDRAEAHHGLRVLGLGEGAVLRLVDGHGRAARARVAAVGRDLLRCQVEEVVELPAPVGMPLSLAVATPKGPRFGDLVRAACELGVGAILPLRCERVSRVPELGRAERVAVEAVKQSGRAHLPQLGPVVDSPTLASRQERLILLDRDGGAPDVGRPRATCIVVGPEGGFTTEERRELLAAGAEPVRVADTILRIETAALAAVAVWVCAWEHHGRTAV